LKKSFKFTKNKKKKRVRGGERGEFVKLINNFFYFSKTHLYIQPEKENIETQSAHKYESM